MAWNCALKDCEQIDIREDRRSIKYIERYGFTEKAIYFEEKYLPFSLVSAIIVKPSVYFPNHSCGKGIPVFKIGLDYGGEKLAVLMFERKNNVKKAVDMICSANPDIIVDDHAEVTDRTTEQE